jgi:hypothetical protein
MKGQPFYTTLGSSKLATEVKLLIDGKWLGKDEIGKDADRVWGDRRIDLSSLSNVESIDIEFEVVANADLYKEAYSLEKIESDIEFGLRIRNSGSRTRRFKKGRVKFKKSSGRSGKNQLVGEISLALSLKEFAGEIEIEPVFLSTKRMVDRRLNTKECPVNIYRGTILGWADPTVVVLERSQRGMSSLFDFVWLPFSEHAEKGLRDSEFFAIKWDSRPIIYLNQELELLETVMTSTAKTGAVAKARNSLDASIAQQAIAVALSASILAARELKSSNEYLSNEDVLESLNPQDKMVLRSWLHAADPDAVGEKTPVKESFSRILEMTDQEVQICLVETMPKNLQVSMGSKHSSEQLLELVQKD